MRAIDRVTRGAVALAVVVPMLFVGPVAAGPSGGALPPALVEVLQVGGTPGIPADAVMVAANVTAVDADGPGYLTVYACDEDQPPTSNVNYGADDVVPNLVFSRIAADGTICIATLAVTDVIVDLVGYVPSGSSIRALPQPVRAVDTRGPAGSGPTRPAGSVLEVPMAGRHGIDPTADVVVFNATAVAADRAGFLTAYPCGTAPATSSVNYQPFDVVPNLVTSRLSPSGSVCISTLAPVDIIVDVVAYATDGIETLDTPQRIFDSRTGGALLPASSVTDIDVAGRADVPDDASAAVYNLTGVGAQGAGFATSYPCGETQPTASNLNYGPAAAVANGAITKLGQGRLCVFTLAPVHLVVDLVGYVRGASQYVPITPVRALDSRQGWQPTCPWVVTETGREVIAVNVDTQEQLVFDLGNGFFSPTAVSPTCDAIWVFVTIGGIVGLPDVSGAWRLGFDGSRTRYPLPVPYPFIGVVFPTLTALDDGTAVMLAGTDLWDVTTWTRLGTVLDATVQVDAVTYPLAWGRLSTDGSTIAAIYRQPGGGPVVLVVRDIVAGVVSATLLDPTVADVHVSPDGTYVVLDLFPVGATGPSVIVVSRFGDEIDADTRLASTGATLFIGTGSLVTCGGTVGLVRWDLFGAPRTVLTAQQLEPASPRFACLGFGR